MSDKNIQSTPFNMRHGKSRIKKKGRAGIDSKRATHTTSAHKGLGFFGAASPGGRGKP